MKRRSTSAARVSNPPKTVEVLGAVRGGAQFAKFADIEGEAAADEKVILNFSSIRPTYRTQD